MCLADTMRYGLTKSRTSKNIHQSCGHFTFGLTFWKLAICHFVCHLWNQGEKKGCIFLVGNALPKRRRRRTRHRRNWTQRARAAASAPSGFSLGLRTEPRRGRRKSGATGSSIELKTGRSFTISWTRIGTPGAKKTFYGRKLRLFISWSVCPWQAFPA